MLWAVRHAPFKYKITMECISHLAEKTASSPNLGLTTGIQWFIVIIVSGFPASVRRKLNQYKLAGS